MSAIQPDSKVAGYQDDQIEMANNINDNENDNAKVTNGLAQHVNIDRTPEEIVAEKRFLRKCDLLILPLLSITYFLASLDRGAISFAETAGMKEDLGISTHKFSTVVSLFYVGYIVFQMPGDLLMKKITPPIQLGAALISWGTFTALSCVAKNYSQIAGLRFLIGVGEAFLQAAPIYLTLWYRREEFATRSGWFFATAALAGAFGGIISYGIIKNLDGKAGLAAWKWIFLIEGVVTVAFGFVVIFLLPGAPERLRWGWSTEEKEYAIRRTREAYNIEGDKLHLPHILGLLKNPKLYLYLVLFCTLQINWTSFQTFLPVLLENFGFSDLDTELMSIPVFFSGAISTIVLGYASDHYKQRGVFIIGCLVADIIGWVLLIANQTTAQSLVGCFCISLGAFPGITLLQSWVNANTIGFTRRAAMFAFLSMVAQSLNIAAAQIYSDAPHYYRGDGFVLGVVVLGLATATCIRFYFTRLNRKKDENRNSDEARLTRMMDIETIGDAHPDFVYWL
ncbi:hypothetical protein SBRCBS47491_009943 [Sporothrix bragantina]|uniref:Major facilitator superfamily (MFS) profile domain-containing protein n=1 Tax=Sporothrix bragantina TaxID=671064 RepID=A0ABP0CYY0_9PEZI